jgi:hypothetical protein
MGSGIGSIPFDRMMLAIDSLLKAAKSSGFQIATTNVALSDFERAWPIDDTRRRTVFTAP